MTTKDNDMYTKGIRKILICDTAGKSLLEIQRLAEKTNHTAVLHNGLVYIQTISNQWVKSPFTIDDFTVTL